jgi:hypothetical protein
VKSELMLLVALAFCAVQAHGPDTVEHPTRCRTAIPRVEPSPGDALPSDSLNCRLVAYCVIPGTRTDVNVDGNIACVASGDSGLYFIEVADPNNPNVVGRWRTLSYSEGVDIDGGYAYVTDGSYVVILDISDPSNPTETSRRYVPGWMLSVTKVGNYAFASNYGAGLWIFDVSDPDTVILVGACGGAGTQYQEPSKVGNYVCVSTYDAGMSVFDVSNPADPSEAGHYTQIDGYCECVEAVGDYAYLTEQRGLSVIDISDPATPRRVGRCSTANYVYSVGMSGHYAYVSAAGSGLRVVDVTDPSDPVEVGHYRISGEVFWTLETGNGYAYVVDDSGLCIIKFVGDVGVAEGGRSPASSSQLTATIVRGVLFLTGDGRREMGDGAALLDAAGRRVMELQPGPNDVQHLSPGVYFVTSPKSVEKVLLTR